MMARPADRALALTTFLSLHWFHVALFSLPPRWPGSALAARPFLPPCFFCTLGLVSDSVYDFGCLLVCRGGLH